MRKFDFELMLIKYRWGWYFRLRFGRRSLELEEGQWSFHTGFGKKYHHYYWGKRRPIKPIEL